ncbi:MAG: hypothetical protein SNJ76_05700 [Fimbriimonadaceae bacterium]
MRELVRTALYGTLPPVPDQAVFREEPVGEYVTAGGIFAEVSRAAISFDGFGFPVDVFLPTGTDDPMPTVVFLSWSHDLAPANGPAATFNRANLDAMLGRGYAVVNVVCRDIVPDEGLAADDRSIGLFGAYPGYDFGAVAAWGFGVSRAVDYVVAQGWADPAKVVASGHSRLGKAVLSAAVFDERIALVNPNGSGLGGSGCFRIRGDSQGQNPDRVERIADMIRHFPHWFIAAFAAHAGREEAMPIDHHTLKALVAPRALVSTEALGDVWANPYGTLATTLAAREVFRWLGVEDRIGLHFRDGGHAQNETDVGAMLDFADEVFFGRPRPSTGQPFPVPPPSGAFDWRAPEPGSG